MARRALPPPSGGGPTLRPIASASHVPPDMRTTVGPKRRQSVMVGPEQPAVLKPAPGRVIRAVRVVRSDAAEVAHHLRQQGLHPRIYERCARAENITVLIWVVVGDADPPKET